MDNDGCSVNLLCRGQVAGCWLLVEAYLTHNLHIWGQLPLHRHETLQQL